MFDKKTTTVVIALLAFAVMYSTFVTESDYTTGKTMASWKTPAEPTWPSPQQQIYHSEKNTPYGGNPKGGCVEVANGVSYYRKMYTNYLKTGCEEVFWSCTEKGSPKANNRYIC